MDGEIENVVLDKGTDNERLKNALRDVREHIKQIDEILTSVEDILGESGPAPDTPASREEIIDLLKKYSRL